MAFLAVFLIGSAASANFDPEDAEQLTVEVRIDFNFGNDVSHSGMIIADGYVITIVDAIADRDRNITVVAADGVEREARPVRTYFSNGIAVLAVTGLDGPDWVRGQGEPLEDLEITATGMSNGQLRIATGSVGVRPGGTGAGLMTNTATYDHSFLGGPVFDRCGSVIGISVPRIGADRTDIRRDDALPRDGRLMRTLSALAVSLEGAGAAPTTAAEVCEPAAVVAAAAAARELEEARQEAERLAREAEEAEARRREAEAAAEAAREQGEEEARAAREAADAAEEEANAAAQAADDAAEALQIAEEEAAQQNNRWRLILALAVGAAVIIIGIIGAIFALRLSRQRSVAAMAEAEADELRKAKVDPFVDCLLVSSSAPPVALPGRLLPLGAGGVLLGRHPGVADAVIASEDVSRRHARIFERDGQLFIVDLNSSNGTTVNGRSLVPNEECPVQAGDEIGVGQNHYTLRIGS